jgi:hypothetical protein
VLVPDRAPTDTDPSPSFQNPMFRFAIIAGAAKCTTNADCKQSPPGMSGVCVPGKGFCADPGMNKPPWTVTTPRDSVFRFTTNGSFVPLMIGLATDGTSLILPQSITYLPSTMELAVTDGINNGLIMVSLETALVSRSFF